MNIKRVAHSCFEDKETIYVVGGMDDQGNKLSSTEKWKFAKNSWQPSANFPEAIYSGSPAVSSNGDEFIGYIASGWTNQIYGLRRRQTAWIKLNKTITIGRYGHSLLNIPANQILGC